MKDQRIIGILLVLLSIAIVILATQGTTLEDRDITPVLLTLPLGLYVLLTKKHIVYDFSPPEP